MDDSRSHLKCGHTLTFTESFEIKLKWVAPLQGSSIIDASEGASVKFYFITKICKSFVFTHEIRSKYSQQISLSLGREEKRIRTLCVCVSVCRVAYCAINLVVHLFHFLFPPTSFSFSYLARSCVNSSVNNKIKLHCLYFYYRSPLDAQKVFTERRHKMDASGHK